MFVEKRGGGKGNEKSERQVKINSFGESDEREGETREVEDGQ